MATLALQEANAGLASVIFGAANAGGDAVPAGARVAAWELPTFLIARNTDATSKTVTVDGVGYVVPATTGVAVIPIRGRIGDLKPVTYSAVVGVTVAAVHLAPFD